MAVEVDEAFQDLAALHASEDVAEERSQLGGIEGVEEAPHLGVGGDVGDAIEGAEVVLGIAAASIEGQQGGILEGEHGEGRHEGVAQGDLDLARSGVRERVEPGADQMEEGVPREVFGCGAEITSHGPSLPGPGSEPGEIREVLCQRELRKGRGRRAVNQCENSSPGIAGLPVISIDTKKKESRAYCYREGRIDAQATIG